MPTPHPLSLMAPLSEEDLDELDRFLMSDIASDETMMLDTLDGYLTAIALGPVTLPPSQWFPGMWGPTAEDAPAFETTEQAQRIFSLILRHLNGIVWSLQHDADTFEPMFDTMVYAGSPREYLTGEGWAHGFMRGVALCRRDWQPLFDDPAACQALRPIYLLGADEVTEEEEGLTRWPNQREELTKQIPASLGVIYRFWLPYRQMLHQRTVATPFEHRQPKIGRNDPCPCGSGKKFKKCCGMAASLH